MKLNGDSLTFSQNMPKKMSEWFIFILIVLFCAVRDIPFLLYGGQIVAYAGIVWQYKRIDRRFTLIWLLFIAWSALTGLWITNEEHYLKFMREISQVSILCILFYNGCKKEQDIERILKFITIASLIMVLYFMIKTPISDWQQAFHSTASVASSEDRFGRSIGYHPNSFGVLCSLECCCWLYQWRQYHRKRALVWGLFLFILLLFTKSRTAVAFFGIIVIVYMAIETKSSRKILGRILLIISVMVIAILSILYIQPLYKLIGYRIEGALSFITGKGTVDASVNGRSILMAAGKEIILDHPIIGVGAGNYSNTAYASYGIWRDVFSHSNYIEIWANLGLVGILLYYIPRFWCLFRLIKRRKITKNRESIILSSFLIAVITAELIVDYITISYSFEATQIFFTLCFAYSIRKSMHKECLQNRKERARFIETTNGTDLISTAKEF